MIYSTNRTTSLGNNDFAVDVNESYFGAGALSFMQENAQDELALFEAAIKSDIDETLIGESTEELAALNEGFVQNAVNKIKEMMRKFIEWLQAVGRSALAKLTQLLVRDNATFCKQARKMIAKMKNSKNFKYSGKALNISHIEGLNFDMNDLKEINSIEGILDKIKGLSSKEALDKCRSELEEELKAFKELDLRKDFNDQCVEEVKDKDIKFVEKHLEFIENADKKQLKNLRKALKDAENKAKKIARDADKAAKDYKGEDEIEKLRLSVMAEAAGNYRTMVQSIINDLLYMIKQVIKISRAVVAKAMGATPKNEGFEYDEELVDAMIESANYEYDEALEEMSEGKDCDDCEDGAEPDDDDEE